MRLLTAAEMRDLDRRTIEEIGLPGVVLMENAGRGAADALRERFAGLFPGPVLVLAGKGNNGGDGFVVARCLFQQGWEVRTVVLAREEAAVGDARLHLQALLRSGGGVEFAPDEAALAAALGSCERGGLVVDALLGTGLATAVAGLYAQAIDWINQSGRPVVALDIPSGVDATSGNILGRAVRADLTVTFAAAKLGHVIHPGAAQVGDLTVLEIGVPAAFLRGAGDRHLLFDRGEAQARLTPRSRTGHKGTFGHLLVIAGSRGKTGAAAMAAEGGLRAGAGLVTIACPESVQPVLAAKVTEIMTVPLPDLGGGLTLPAFPLLEQLWEGKKAVALGPGLGQAEETFALARRIVRGCPLPLVVDADALNALGGHCDLLRERPATAILTPHPGEMARLCGIDIPAIEKDRVRSARDFAREYGVVLVLKGAPTVTALPDGRVRINGSGNPGMASGGMGDILTGVLGGLLSQGLPAEEAAPLGVYLHGLAADRLVPRLGDAGMIATDLLSELPAVRRDLLQGRR